MVETPADGYANELRREIMRSEVQRVQVLAIVLSSLLIVTLIAANFFPDFTQRMFRGGIAGWEPLAAIGPFVLYEWVVLFVLCWRTDQDKDFPRIGRFANALIETSLPSVIIFELSHHMDMSTVLGFWPPMLYFVFILLSTLRLDFWLSVWTGAVAAVQLLALAAWLLPIEPFSTVPEHALTYNVSRSIVLLACGIIAGIVAGSLRRQFETSVAAAAARDRVTNLFGQHVSPAVVDRLLAARTDPPSEMRRVCVLFLDIRGFTAMTRVRAASATVALLNDFFAEMVAIVDHHHGIINKFLGDGFLALFGAPLEDPKAAVNALAAARGMLDAVDAWNKARPDNALRVGIGVHIGEAVTGTVGSPQRKEYTVIGDTVNLAARLEQLTKETGARLLVSSSVHEATTGADGATDLGPLAIRGYDEAIRVWRVA
ncbi:MAG: adenylate cyclase [Rhodospirillaceae bacterium]|jgi:adenylate cyclase|nr:adenylate cyclase [Rhodospirillaceae bacterium]MEA2810128.1 adenylate cyclase [Rhodospirillaceae bacterium]